ncbi:MAG: glycine--tRNA ligase [Halobacteriales archaeon]|nr:glycine--tRNA ligase [Halobacteriales archaeon]
MSERAALSELAKRRGFFSPAAEAYGGVAGFYVYGPAGATLKRNIEAAWRERFVVQEGHQEIDAPTVMPEPVFEASGHLENFNDLLVACAECDERHRADHLVEDASDVEDAEAMAPEALGELIAELGLSCPSCGAAMAGQPVETFNLMFETTIGPGDGAPGYLRPETAQGTFVEFPRLAEYARGQLPFGVAQIGRAYRNEISPRNALLRVRELTQAELELFVDPEHDEPDLAPVADVPLRLYTADAQGAEGTSYLETTVEEAAGGVVANEWIAYYLGRTREWYERIGVDMDRFRFRQHLAGERSHYASDCWDAEAEVDGDWIELAGLATRGSYDLGKHQEHSDDEFTVFREYDEPVTVERATVDPDMAVLGPEFGAEAREVAAALADLAERDPEAFDAETVTVEVDGEAHEVDAGTANFGVETVTERGEHILPHVVEPAFGIGRAVYTVLAHRMREDEVDGEARTLLSLPPAVAPTLVGVFPLMDRDGLGERARELTAELRAAGLAVEYDDAGSIGRRYRRQDEVGTPYCVTVDYESLEDGAVTVRDRDTAAQRRVELDGLVDHLVALRDGERAFDSIGDPVADA